MRSGGVWALALLCACAKLPEIGAGECGNGVIEPPEDCDTFGVDGGAAQCRPKGSVGECHLDCTPDSDGERPACPAGWGCDGAGLCRRPTGEFEPLLREYEVGSAVTLSSGDFDGDGNADLMSLEAPEGLGYTRTRFHYFDDQAELRESREYARAVFKPEVGDLSLDGKSDVIFTDSRVGVLLGRADRAWVPETFSSYRLLDTSIRTLGVFEAPVQQAASFVVFASLDGRAGVYVPDAANAGTPRLLSELSGPNEALAGDPVSGHVIEDRDASPCAQIVFALLGETRFWMLDVCGRDTATGQPVWLDDARRTALPLVPPEPVDAAPLIADVNLDGHLDVLVGANGRVHVAYGDGATLAAPAPLQLSIEGRAAPSDIEMPLAVGDLTNDAAVDFMFDDRALFSLAALAPGRFDYVESLIAEPGHWTAAAIADFNGNGRPDLVLASTERSGVDFFNSSVDGWLTQFRITTARPIQHLAVGDFNGDFINDLGLSQIGAESASADSVLIAYGEPAGAPETAIQVASLPRLEQISVFREGAVDHMVLSSSDTRDGRERGVLTLLAGGVGNELPVALYELTRFAADSTTLGAAAVRALGGRFTREDRGDVFAIGAPADAPIDSSLALEYWLLPALTVDDGTPVLLEGRLPPAASPVTGSGVEAVLHLSVQASDFDGDGLDEVALAVPADGGAHCAISVLDVEPERVAPRASFVIEEPCLALELLSFDADADGWLDLALLAGGEGFAEGRLSVFWNDGAGGFDAESRSLVAGPEDPPVAFAPFERTPARDTSFMYVTASQFHLTTLAAGSRDFMETRTPAELTGCTGMAALDLDGDGVRDLALATSGNLLVQRALLENL